jgi:hypothetical protein
MDLRTLLAAGLGVLLGLLCLLAPEAIVRVHLAGRTRPDRHGEYGDDSVGSARLLWLVRAVGAVVLLGGVYFGAVAAGLA